MRYLQVSFGCCSCSLAADVAFKTYVYLHIIKFCCCYCCFATTQNVVVLGTGGHFCRKTNIYCTNLFTVLYMLLYIYLVLCTNLYHTFDYFLGVAVDSFSELFPGMHFARIQYAGQSPECSADLSISRTAPWFLEFDPARAFQTIPITAAPTSENSSPVSVKASLYLTAKSQDNAPSLSNILSWNDDHSCCICTTCLEYK